MLIDSAKTDVALTKLSTCSSRRAIIWLSFARTQDSQPPATGQGCNYHYRNLSLDLTNLIHFVEYFEMQIIPAVDYFVSHYLLDG